MRVVAVWHRIGSGTSSLEGADRYQTKDRSLVNIALYGTGRAAGALGLAFVNAGHTIVSIDGRTPSHVDALASLVGLGSGAPELRVIAVSDDAIGAVAGQVSLDMEPLATVHVSGAVQVSVLDPIAATGVQTGSFHPLQTLPNATTGADQLPGSWIGITADDPLHKVLVTLATSVGCHVFDLDDAAKPLYHAAAAASANFTLAVLDLAEDLFEAAGVPFESARPLVEAIVANAFELGSRQALTGPIARGDVATVAGQLRAVRSAAGDRVTDFAQLAALTARTAGTEERFSELFT